MRPSKSKDHPFGFLARHGLLRVIFLVATCFFCKPIRPDQAETAHEADVDAMVIFFVVETSTTHVDTWGNQTKPAHELERRWSRLELRSDLALGLVLYCYRKSP